MSATANFSQSQNSLEISHFNKAQKSQDCIQAHSAWQGNLSASEAESLLQGKKVFTYLLRSGSAQDSYHITFVKEDGSIHHELLTFKTDQGLWCYKNFTTIYLKKTVNELIPAMLHCDAIVCNSFSSDL